jgi:hypothetical protein
LVQGIQTRQQAMRLLCNGFHGGKPLLLLRFQARDRGGISSHLGGDMPAEVLKFVLIPLELRAPVCVDGSFPSQTGATHAFCLRKGLVT